MELDDKNRLADRWLDAAIKQYNPPEPEFGMEERILRRVRAVPEKPAYRGMWAAWALAAATVLVIAGMLIHRGHPASPGIAVNAPISNINVARGAETLATPPIVTSSGKHPGKAPRRTPAVPVWPAQFPLPQPLTAQEEMLSRYVQERPQEARLMARARSEILRQDGIEFEKQDPATGDSQIFEQ